MALSFEQGGKHSIAIGRRQFHERLFRADRGERVRHARALGKATISAALADAMTSPRFEHAAPQGEHLVVIAGIRVFERRIEHVVENNSAISRSQRCDFAQVRNDALNPWASTALPVLGSFQSPRRCSRP